MFYKSEFCRWILKIQFSIVRPIPSFPKADFQRFGPNKNLNDLKMPYSQQVDKWLSDMNKWLSSAMAMVIFFIKYSDFFKFVPVFKQCFTGFERKKVPS